MKKDNFDKPICLDQSDKLNELNHFPADGRFQTFLLDKYNKVVVIGNPIHNPNIRELYLKEVTGKQPASQIQTTVKVEEASIQLGTIQMGESKEAVFRLTNTGNNPLVILDAATTCGCARPSFDKHPAKPGEILQVRVIMTPKDKGVFDDDYREMQYESTDKIKHSGDGSINKKEGRACRIYWNDHKQASHPTFTHEAERR